MARAVPAQMDESPCLTNRQTGAFFSTWALDKGGGQCYDASTPMIGAITGDMVGSRFEFDPIKKKDFTLLHPDCRPTDDSYMSLAVCLALLESRSEAELPRLTVRAMQELGRAYPDGCYGGRFSRWLEEPDPQPYNSFGNGSAMRISGVAYVARSEDELRRLCRLVTEVTHNHPEGLKGAEATAMACYMALHGSSKEEIRARLRADYYPMDFTLDEIRDDYEFSEICQSSVPEALQCFLESTSFEDSLRNAVSLGGDADTQAAIAGAVAECFYGGVPAEIRRATEAGLDAPLLSILRRFEARYPHPSGAPRLH